MSILIIRLSRLIPTVNSAALSLLKRTHRQNSPNIVRNNTYTLRLLEKAILATKINIVENVKLHIQQKFTMKRECTNLSVLWYNLKKVPLSYLIYNFFVSTRNAIILPSIKSWISNCSIHET